MKPPERRETSQGARRCYQGRSASTRDKPWDTAQLLALPHTCRLPRTPAPQHGHRSQLEGHLCARRSSWQTWLLFADGCWDHWKSRLRLQHGCCPARARQHSPPQPSSQGNPQGDALVPQHRPGTGRGAEALRPLAALARTGRDAARQPRARAARRPRGHPGGAGLQERNRSRQALGCTHTRKGIQSGSQPRGQASRGAQGGGQAGTTPTQHRQPQVLQLHVTPWAANTQCRICLPSPSCRRLAPELVLSPSNQGFTPDPAFSPPKTLLNLQAGAQLVLKWCSTLPKQCSTPEKVFSPPKLCSTPKPVLRPQTSAQAPETVLDP